MIRRPPRSTRTDTLFPYTTLFRSKVGVIGGDSFRQPLERGKREASLDAVRSEEHTSELQSLMRISYAVLCLKNKNHSNHVVAVLADICFDYATLFFVLLVRLHSVLVTTSVVTTSALVHFNDH